MADVRHLLDRDQELRQAVAEVDRSLIGLALARSPRERASGDGEGAPGRSVRPVKHPTVVDPEAFLGELVRSNVEFIVVGGTAAVLQAAPVTTQDLDIVHRR